jgi:hypothetical protein
MMSPVLRTRCLLLALPLLALAPAACAAGTPAPSAATGRLSTQTRSVHGFSAVLMIGVGTLRVAQSARQQLTIQAAADVLPQLRSQVVAGTLELGPAPGARIRTDRPIVYTLTTPRLGSISMAGAGDLQLSAFQATALTIELEGSARGELHDLAIGRLAIKQAGAATLLAAGRADEQVVSLSGAARYDGSGLVTTSTRVSISGAGSARVDAERWLTVVIEGAGSVMYSGSPTVQQQILGAGTVSRV